MQRVPSGGYVPLGNLVGVQRRQYRGVGCKSAAKSSGLDCRASASERKHSTDAGGTEYGAAKEGFLRHADESSGIFGKRAPCRAVLPCPKLLDVFMQRDGREVLGRWSAGVEALPGAAVSCRAAKPDQAATNRGQVHRVSPVSRLHSGLKIVPLLEAGRVELRIVAGAFVVAAHFRGVHQREGRREVVSNI
jgi:hypothetical protein